MWSPHRPKLTSVMLAVHPGSTPKLLSPRRQTYPRLCKAGQVRSTSVQVLWSLRLRNLRLPSNTHFRDVAQLVWVVVKLPRSHLPPLLAAVPDRERVAG